MRAAHEKCFVHWELLFKLKVLRSEPAGARISRVFALRPDFLTERLISL